jgi:ribulose-bisphosphate carboxylase large chain
MADQKKELSYLRLDYQPLLKEEIIAIYYLQPKEGVSFKEAAEKIAAESSIGTWTKLSNLSATVFQKLAARLFYLDEEKGIIKIAYPLALFEKGNIPQLLSSIAGNVFSMKEIKSLRLEDVLFPFNYLDSFLGPAFGWRGVRRVIGIEGSPVIIGSIMKPKVGLSSKENAELAYQVFKNGVDFAKDDENLTDLANINPFQERVRRVMELKKKAEKETGCLKLYAFNVTAPLSLMIERAKYVREQGGKCVMIDIVAVGWSALQDFRNQNLGLIIHGHRAGHSAFTRSQKHGISMKVIAKLARLAGVDNLHTGTVIGKMEGEKKDVQEINKFLRSEWGNLKEVFPVASGGLHPALVPGVISILGTNLIMNFGGGLHGHPDGITAGAQAVKAAFQAVTENISLEEKAQENPALKKALDYWSV